MSMGKVLVSTRGGDMAIDEVVGETSTRKHDDPGMPVVAGASRTETHNRNNRHQAIGFTLNDLAGVPGCLDQGFIDRLLGETVKPFATEPLSSS